MKNKRVKTRHRFFNIILKAIFFPIAKLRYHYKIVNKYKIKKDEAVFILSNHQTDIDPALICYSFNKPLYIVATDTLFSNSFAKWFLPYACGVIPKKKGMVDFNCTMQMLKTAKEKGSVLLFPEGNRTYAEFQFYISDKLPALIKKMGLTLVLFQIHGGTGTQPRFMNKIRKGKFYGKIEKVLKYEEYKDLSNEEILQIIKDNIKVYDSDSNDIYKSKRRAEYLEEVFFVCPKCQSISTLKSQNNYIRCNHCQLEVEYTENLRLKSDDSSFTFNYLNDWYQYQKQWVKDYVVKKGEKIFNDSNTVLYESNPYVKRKLLAKGDIQLNDQMLSFPNFEFQLKDITQASVISGRKFTFSTNDCSYLVVGEGRFNPLKYVLMFNKLDTTMKTNKTDDYFNLEDTND